jgi:hypothetical protein
MQSCLGAGDDRVLARADIRAVTWEQLKSGRHARQARDEIAFVGREPMLMDFDELETLAGHDGWLVGGQFSIAEPTYASGHYGG